MTLTYDRPAMARTATPPWLRFGAYSDVVPEPTLSGPPEFEYGIQGLRGRVVFDRDQWVALEDSTGLFGEGDDPEAAVLDLFTALVDHVRDLRAHAGRLAPEFERELVALEHLLPL